MRFHIIVTDVVWGLSHQCILWPRVRTSMRVLPLWLRIFRDRIDEIVMTFAEEDHSVFALPLVWILLEQWPLISDFHDFYRDNVILLHMMILFAACIKHQEPNGDANSTDSHPHKAFIMDSTIDKL